MSTDMRRESVRLEDQAETLADLLHCDTKYSAGSLILEAGCGVGSQTVSLASNSPDAKIISVVISESSLSEAKKESKPQVIRSLFSKRRYFEFNF
jgi:cyclopropane fatty-acyl-phospholipid synthase-like methyltransferase